MNVDEFAEWTARELARRPVTRRSVLRAAGGLAVAQLVLAGCDTSAKGLAITGRHLSFVPEAPGRAMALTAQLLTGSGTLPSGLRAWVELGDEPGRYGTRIDADVTHLVLHVVHGGTPAGSQFYLKARLDDLRPHTVYHYRIRLSDGTTTSDAHFTTAPVASLGTVPAPFTFTAFADVGTNRAPANAKHFVNRYDADDPVAGKHGTDRRPAATQTRLMATQRPAFTLLAGDICYADSAGVGLPRDAYNPYVWDAFLAQIDPAAASTPWMFATGNHDMESLYPGRHGYAAHEQRLDLPTNGPRDCPSVYTFTYGNVGVVSVDANELSAEIQTNTGYSDGAQLAWLDRALGRLRADPVVDFLVAFFHHCAYATSQGHASDGGVRAALDPLFSRHRVDLAIQGHNHVLERTDPIRHGHRTRAAPDGATIQPATDGTTYICVGSGGRARAELRKAAHGGQPEGPRYRGYQSDGRSNNGERVVNSFVWSTEGTSEHNGYPAGTRLPESVDWSQVRYDGYAFLAVDVVPAARGETTTMTVRTLADALPGTHQPYTEIDRITLERTAGNVR